jgi:hypothetical protein
MYPTVGTKKVIVMTTKLSASVAFSGEFGDPEYTTDPEREIELDPERAAAELREAGYDVFLMPEKHSHRLAHPLDDFIEAVIEGPDDPKVIDAIMNEVNAIVDRYGGLCMSCGPIGKDYVPFADLFEDAEPDQRLMPVPISVKD